MRRSLRSRIARRPPSLTVLTSPHPFCAIIRPAGASCGRANSRTNSIFSKRTPELKQNKGELDFSEPERNPAEPENNPGEPENNPGKPGGTRENPGEPGKDQQKPARLARRVPCVLLLLTYPKQLNGRCVCVCFAAHRLHHEEIWQENQAKSIRLRKNR